MALPLTTRIVALQAEVRRQKELLQTQQTILGVQFTRIADIQAELDLIKAAVRLAAPEHHARFFGSDPNAPPLIVRSPIAAS